MTPDTTLPKRCKLGLLLTSGCGDKDADALWPSRRGDMPTEALSLIVRIIVHILCGMRHCSKARIDGASCDAGIMQVV